MPSVAINKFDQFAEDIAHKVHDLSGDSFVVFLTDTAPTASDETIADITQADYTYCSSRALTVSSSAQTAGVYKWSISDITLSASGGSVGPFRYVGIYNDTPTSPADPLVCWYDYGSSVTMADGDSLDIDFDDASGVLTIT